MSSPQARQTRTFAPSGRTRKPTRTGWLQLLQMSMTLEMCSGASFSTMPAWVPMARCRMWRLIMFTPCTTTRFFSGKTCRTWPCFPLPLPAMTSTRSSRLMRRTLDHLRRQGDDLHEVALAQLAGHGAEDARPPWVLVVGQEDSGVLIEADVGAVPPPVGLGRPHPPR